MVSTLVLKEFGLFRGLDESELVRIAELCREHPMKSDEVIFSEGTRAAHLHLCRNGKVDIVIRVREPWNKNVTVHTAGAGELFGWSAMVAPYTYTASAECADDGEEIRIMGAELLKLFDKNPRVGLVVWRNLSAEISARLTQTRQRLSTEWLTAGIPSSGGASTWGEPKRR
jgi:CRP-like cAMP-binding protein